MRYFKVLLVVAVVYLVYVLVSGILVFYIIRPEPAKAVDIQFKETNERVSLIDRPSDAWQARVDLISRAQETIDIAYYAFHGGESVDLFVGLLLDAADRGVQVRFLMDGVANGIRFEPEIYRVLVAHPNIEFAFYEPLHVLQPWTWHNRMHDKIIVVDGEVAMMGGRNIGDKYFTDDVPSLSIDRDVMVFKGDTGQDDTYLLSQLANHFTDLWTSDYSVVQTRTFSASKQEEILRQQAEFVQKTHQKTTADPNLTQWYAKSHPVRGASFVTNPLGRFYKEGVVWEYLLALTKQAEKSIIIQTPYIIPTVQMREDMEQQMPDDEVATNLLTNSLASTNNLIANSGYQNNRQEIIDQGTQIYEFQPNEAQFHTKAIIIDERISAIGTFNMDSRSAYLNTESMLIFDSPSLAAELLSNIEVDYGQQIVAVDEDNPADQSDYSSAKYVVSRLLQPIARLFAPFL